MQSGNMFNSWVLKENPKEAAFRLAKLLGCEKEDPKDIVDYLKSVPATDLVKHSKLEVCNTKLFLNVFNDIIIKNNLFLKYLKNICISTRPVIYV